MKDDFEGLSLNSLRECFELVSSPPDEDLLRKYVGEERGQIPNARLTAREREWIEVNLRCNPVWQEAYRAASTEAPVNRIPHRLVQIVVAVSILIVAPLWMDSLYVSREPSEEVLTEELELGGEVLRGSYSAPIQVPHSQEHVPPLSLNSLVEVNPLRFDTTSLALLKRHMIEQYHSAQDEYDRARAALRLTRLSLILRDGDGAEFWRRNCEAEGVGDCR